MPDRRARLGGMGDEGVGVLGGGGDGAVLRFAIVRLGMLGVWMWCEIRVGVMESVRDEDEWEEEDGCGEGRLTRKDTQSHVLLTHTLPPPGPPDGTLPNTLLESHMHLAWSSSIEGTFIRLAAQFVKAPCLDTTCCAPASLTRKRLSNGQCPVATEFRDQWISGSVEQWSACIRISPNVKRQGQLSASPLLGLHDSLGVLASSSDPRNSCP